MTNPVFLIVQARMGSTRLPGKIMRQVQQKPLLEYMVERLRKVNLADGIIIATTQAEQEEPIIEWCDKHGINYYRGSENDVLSRYYEAASKYEARTVVRLTSDCPLIDPNLVDRVIKYYLENDYDYVSNVLIRTYPRGMDTEVFSYRVLEQAYNLAAKSSEREHVTAYIYNHPESFRLGSVTGDRDYSRYRLTVDTPEDFQLIAHLLEYVTQTGAGTDYMSIVRYLETHPEIAAINAHVEQKKV